MCNIYGKVGKEKKTEKYNCIQWCIQCMLLFKMQKGDEGKYVKYAIDGWIPSTNR